jgi:Spx/MgsR family transcriptional regulator
MLAGLFATGRLSGLITLYGIKNCDTVQKARKWLDLHDVEYRFHDFRADGLDRETVAGWLEELGWERVVNKRSTSWKALDAATREGMDNSSALAAILAQPTLVKRPLLDTGHERITGFSAASYQAIFRKHTL